MPSARRCHRWYTTEGPKTWEQGPLYPDFDTLKRHAGGIKGLEELRAFTKANREKKKSGKQHPSKPAETEKAEPTEPLNEQAHMKHAKTPTAMEAYCMVGLLRIMLITE